MDRDRALERYLLDIAAQAAGHTRPEGLSVVGDDGGLGAFADHRAHPGPVHLPRDFDREAAEELADCCSYLIWGIQEHHAAFLAGDAGAVDAYERRMRALAGLVRVWHDLHRPSA